MEKFYPYLDIIFLIFVVIFLIFMLYRVIGKKLGLQRSEKLEANYISGDIKGIIQTGNKNVNNKNSQVNVDVYAEGSLNSKLEKVKQLESNFSFKEFISSCKESFKSIVENFNKGDLESVKNLLSPKMYDSFNKHIQENNINNKVIVDRFLLVDINSIDIKEDIININVKFLVKLNFNNDLIEIREIWTFTKNNTINNKTWYLSKVVND